MTAKHRNKYDDKNGICTRCGKKQEANWKPCVKCGGTVVRESYKQESEERNLKSVWWKMR